MRSRHWFATFNNYIQHGVESVEEFYEGLVSKGGANYCVGQLEKGESGTPHM